MQKQKHIHGKKLPKKYLASIRVALVYDRVNKWGGAERVLLALHELFPKAPLYTSVYNPKTAAWAKVFPSIHTSFIQKIPWASSMHELYAFFMPVAFERFSFSDYDIVISITSESAKAVYTKTPTIHLCYCLTPTRYLWSGYKEYFSNGLMRFLTFPLVASLRFLDKIGANRPDAYIAISKEVQKRVKKYYGRESSVIYPPVQLLKGSSKIKKGEYFLVVSRLVSYKRIDIAIEACNKLGVSLKIVGTGYEEEKLKKMAGLTIEFLGNLTDKELVQYYKGCLALLFPGNEDFGIAVVEAQRLGKPVIAYRGGGALETIREGKTGELFYPQTAKALMITLKRFKPVQYKPEACVRQVKQFDKRRFLRLFKEEIEKRVLHNV